MDLIQYLQECFLQVTREVFDALENGRGYLELEERLQEILGNFARSVLKGVLETADAELRRSQAERPGWVIERRDEAKLIITPFGEVTYRRSYFQHKQTGEYAHLVDRLAGVEPHCRIDAAAKAQLLENAVDHSYRKSGQKLDVSGQAVLEVVRQFSGQGAGAKEEAQRRPKRSLRFLYVEADEDHVASQRGRALQIPLVYVHEGKTGPAKRYKLKEAHYFAGPYASVEDLWLDVFDYLDSHYELDRVERVFVAGDGANWVRAGAKLLPKATFVLDKFHLKKWITGAVGTEWRRQSAIWAGIQRGDRKAIEQVLKEALQEAETVTRRQAVLNCWRYIRSNWDGIEAYQLEGVTGCSAEGHVSHILSARLSSRPAGWSKLGAEQMARLRVMQANGKDVRRAYLREHRENMTDLLALCRRAITEQRQRLDLPWPEQLGNIPALFGPKSQLTRALKALRYQYPA